ncbi:MAG: hypothetical protein Q8764_02020 [Pigeon pea little leaf phytoplasma]|uniref:Uncharacterized protein n=1 Tax=Candidatus Phytoplasma fabacearum TaxID=2982628 RepID=A0ABU8ZSZ7_9MOLU|nr:hypothetical protein ['Bituminaria bituminosa' little leaf phytoplasma]MDV3149020.1 hypothetical protein [Pigeon pea little leaf phytoplasma]MDO7983759.1 hypothetical protein ['Bituminaria bituminosa' little leaf phytoplasma]MDO8024028.1 hypothetical protein ['Bituminaria bituminosa' little leaf phytoplasma]MDO8030778.1 hypothetical protein ['Bituminaria bituminosa' little leaf phytoplasma]MDV3154250.1 hypothetical protein [Pigeon pea little leaf phytoplasma]
MNNVFLFCKIKKLFLYFLKLMNHSQIYSDIDYENMDNIYIIKLADKIIEQFSLSEITINIEFLQEHLLYYLQEQESFLPTQEYNLYMIIIFLESFYFAEFQIVNHDENANILNHFETEYDKRNLKKIFN